MNRKDLTRYMYHDRIPSNDNSGLNAMAGLAVEQGSPLKPLEFDLEPGLDACIRLHVAVRDILERYLS